MSRIRAHFDRELILLLVFSLFAVAPLLSSGYFFDAHDADHSVFFLVEFDAAIRDGALWPRWGPDHALGFGYPLWLLYAPLAYYAAEAFHLVGLGFTAAVKATWALGFLFGGWGMYVLLRRWWGRGAALVGGLIYVYAPYHLLTIFVRAAFAEFMAMAWFPWVLLAFDDLVERGGPWRVALAALALGGLFLTHTGTLLIFTPVLAAYLIFALARAALRVWRDEDRWRAILFNILRVAAAGALALGLAAIFLLPMLLEQGGIVQEQWVAGSYGYRGHFVFPNQFLDPFWGFGYSDDLTGAADGMSFQLGVVAVVLAITALAVALRRSSPRRGHAAFFVGLLLVTLALTLPVAQPLWDAFSPAALIQFPWRLLGIATLSLAILAGAAVANLLKVEAGSADSTRPPEQVSQFPAAHILALVVVLGSLAFTIPQATDIEPIDESAASIIRFETTYPDMIGFTTAVQQPFTETPLLPQYLAGEPLQKAVLLSGTGTVEKLRVGGASVDAEVNAEGPDVVLFYTYDFPGWRASIDGQPAPHRVEPPYGLIAVDVPAGKHTVSIRHGDTPIRRAGTLISLACLAIVIALLLAPTLARRRQRSAEIDTLSNPPTPA